MMTPSGEWFPVAGGRNASVNGDIVLCSRNDADPQRMFSGSIAHVELRSAALGAKEVSAIYNTYAAGIPTLDQIPSQAEPELPPRPPCAFPFTLNGTDHSGCIRLHAHSVCRDADDEWQFCEASEKVAVEQLKPDQLCQFPLRWQARAPLFSSCLLIEWYQLIPTDTN